jgi:hypothetical protein
MLRLQEATYGNRGAIARRWRALKSDAEADIEGAAMLKVRQCLVAAIVAAYVVACGGAGSSSSMSGMKPVMATGVITGFGSIFVDGIHFQTTNATIRKNGQTVAQSQLAVGEVARIKGAKNDADETGVADEVDVDESVVGPISAIDTTNNVVTVLAQMVKINAGTSFSNDITPADITGLTMGETIRVDGMMDSSGTIVATRIEPGSASDPLQVVGTVSSLDSTAHTFMINALIVDYSGATLDGFPSGGPSNGDVVRVQGTSFDATTKTLTATTVSRHESDEEEAGDDRDTEREGLITRFASATDFDVAGQPVTTTSSTVYHNGTASNLALNVKVEVEGMLNSSNVLVASEVSFEHNGGVELQGQAAAVDATAGTLTLLGVHITVNSMTRFEDFSSMQVQNFNLSNVSNGDTIRVRGYESPPGSGMVVATSLVRVPPSSDVLVQGPFTAGTSPDFTVLGITIDASAATISSGGESGTTLTLATFLTQAVGHSVKVEGTLSGSVVKAAMIRIDDETGDED